MKHPEMHTKVKVGKFFGGEKKFNFVFSKNESCLKLPELPRNHVSRGGGVVGVGVGGLPYTDRQTTGQTTWQSEK